MAAPDLADAVSTFGAAAQAKFANPVAQGAPEDQLRAPLEPAQADLLERLCAGPLLGAEALRAAGAFDEPGTAATRRAAAPGQMTLL